MGFGGTNIFAGGRQWVLIDVVLHGVRGTRTVTGSQFAQVGADTSCVGVRIGLDSNNELSYYVLLDAGTGIAAAGQSLFGTEEPIAIFLSHLHHDHMAGLPFFAPLFEEDRTIYVYIPQGMRERMLAYFAPPYYPLTMDDLPANVVLKELGADASVPLVDGVAVAHSLNLPGEVHPRDGVTTYAVQVADTRVVYASDFEWQRASAADQQRLLHFARDADLLIVDAQYAEDEYEVFAGRGHNTVRTATMFGASAGAQQIVLFHHDPHRDDEAVAELEVEAQALDGMGPDRVFAGRAGMKFTL